MYDKDQLGNRYACYECGTKFYDLNRPEALCPECNADQANAPVKDIKALLSSGRRRKPREAEAPAPEEEEDTGTTGPDEYDEDAELEEEDGEELEELDLPG